MNILITEDQFKNLIENIIKEDNIDYQKQMKLRHKMEDWFVKLLDTLTEKKSDKYPDSIFYINKENDEIYMEHNELLKQLYINYYKIWKYFYNNYSSKYQEIQKLINQLVSEHLNIQDVTPLQIDFNISRSLVEYLN